MAVPGYWVGDVADERRVKDDIKAGRLAWRSRASDRPEWGYKALPTGNLALAKELLVDRDGLVHRALESRIEPKDMAFLSNSAQRRGRQKKYRRKKIGGLFFSVLAAAILTLRNVTRRPYR